MKILKINSCTDCKHIMYFDYDYGCGAQNNRKVKMDGGIPDWCDLEDAEIGQHHDKWEKVVGMKPCPFCGCTEVETFPATDERSAMVCCVNCPCGFEIDGYDIEALLEVWNVRNFPPWDGRPG